MSETADLRTIVSGTSECVKIRDKNSKEHIIAPLDLSDLIEYEDKMGYSILNRTKEIKIRDIAYILYLSLRKEGLSADQIEHRQFTYTERQVWTMFDLKFLTSSNEILMDLLRISGLEVRKEGAVADPTPVVA